MMQKIAIGSDHAGFELKEALKELLQQEGFEFHDFGTHGSESVDYPDYAHAVASAVEKKEYDLGVLVCGSANGVCMTANKHQGIRAALAWSEEIAALARQHNNANVICLPGRFVSKEQGKNILDSFLHSSFEGGRHERRTQKISF